MRQKFKDLITENPLGARLYGAAQETWFDFTYRRRRERYEAAARSDPGAHHEAAHVARARQKIAARGYAVKTVAPGEVHTFAYVPSNWSHQDQIVDGLRKLGPLSRFDYAKHGWTLAQLRTRSAGHAAARRAVHARLLSELRKAHHEKPVDIFFSYALGWDLDAHVLREIQDTLGVPCVNISLDDKNWWDEVERGDAESALKAFAPQCDLAWTSARSVLSWYWAERGQAVFLPEGVNVEWFAPEPGLAQDIEVGFIGSRFGYRPEILRSLKKLGVDVEAHGPGWPGGTLSDAEMLRFFNRCQINLGLGDMHFSRWLTNLKGRDFEIPAVGRGLYLTTYNADLASCFEVGSEIQCYRGLDEMIELIRHHLRNPDESAAMATRARARCVAAHQWQHRYLALLKHLGIVAASSSLPESG